MESQKENSKIPKRQRRGYAVVELSLLMPWLYFLFAGALDFGFYAHSLISVQNATRIAALNAGFSGTGALSQTEACYHVRRELAAMPNAQSFPAACDASPLIVTVSPFNDAEGMPASRIGVSYEGLQMVPIPGVLTGKYSVKRTVDVRVYGE